jgi:hypothetical protein
MNRYIIYDIASGEVVSQYQGKDEGAALQCKDGQSYIQSDATELSHYVSEGTLIAYTDDQKEAKGEFKGAGWEWSNESMDWIINDQSMANEFALIMLRIKRDELLAKSDYTQMPDLPLSNKDLWDTYRQALRDLPETYSGITSLDEVEWPQPPQ